MRYLPFGRPQIFRNGTQQNFRNHQQVSKAALELFVQCSITLIRGWMGDDAAAIVDRWIIDGPFRVTAEERELVLLNVAAIGALFEPLRGTIERDALDVTELLKKIGQMGADPAAYPGQTLTMLVGSGKQRDARRRRERSDWVDIDHVAHFPYVDIASCDAGTFHVASAVLGKIACLRAVRLFRNGNLDEVAAALRGA